MASSGERVGNRPSEESQNVAEEKDTDPAPDQGLTGSDSANPGSEDLQGEYDQLDALDEREDEFDDADDQDDDSEDSEDSDGDSDQADDFDDDFDDDSEDGDRELVGVGAASRSGSASRGGKSLATSPATGRGRKGRATPKQRAAAEQNRRSGPIGFVKGSVSELQKVVYPTWPQLANYFVVVLIFVLMIIAIVAGLDYGFGWLMLKAFT